MTFQVLTFNQDGKQVAILGPFGNIASARQGMLNHSNTVDLPNEEPFSTIHLTSKVTEGWFIGQAEYHIINA